MSIPRIAATSLLSAVLALLAASCGGGGEPQWFSTCGPPVSMCNANTMPTNAVCTTEKEGTPCTEQGKICDLKTSCGFTTLVCLTNDPKAAAGGCSK